MPDVASVSEKVTLNGSLCCDPAAGAVIVVTGSVVSTVYVTSSFCPAVSSLGLTSVSSRHAMYTVSLPCDNPLVAQL